MIRLTWLALLLVPGCSWASAQEDAEVAPAAKEPMSFPISFFGAATTISSYAEGKAFTSNTPDDIETSTPVWTADSPNPPLSAEEAIRLAIDVQRRLVHDTERSAWGISHAGLVCLEEGCWYWLITFESHPTRGGASGIPPYLELIVTMDGKVVEPNVSDARDVTDPVEE